MAALSKTEANLAGAASVEAALARKLYEDMLLIRRFEEKAGQLYGMGLIGGFCHLYIGQEAVVVGMQAALEPGDQVITAYRDHGHMLATGMDPKGVMAELTGRAVGYSKGKGGSMHMFSRNKNFFGGHGIVGAQVPIGTGLAFANKYRDNHAVSLTYFGDGAANQGQVYELFNMAELWKLPIVYIIENNRYAMGTSVERSSAEAQLYKRGASFNIPGEEVDGMDVEAVFAAGRKAVQWARGGKGPIILEMKTYRYRGHSMSDPAKYRTREEVQSVREKRDPIEHYGQRLIARGQASDEELKAIDKNVRGTVNFAAEFATESPEPQPAELYTDVLGLNGVSIQILMPALSPTMEEGKLAKWLVKEGDEIHSGDVLAEIETDKATMEFEAVDEGRIGKILVPEGTEGVKVNQPIAELVGKDESAAKPLSAAAPKAEAVALQPPESKAEVPGPRASPPASPKAKQKANEDVRGHRESVQVVESTVPAGTEFVTITVREALRDAMAEEMRRDADVFLMGEEVAQYQGAYKVSQGLLEEFGARRVVDTPITEQGFAGLGVGAAFAGLRPIVEFMTMNFAMQAIDQLINSAAKTRYMSGGQMNCPIVFRGPNGAASRVAAQHSQDYGAWYAQVPGLKVVSPYFAADAKGLLKSAIRDLNPVIFLENEIVYGRSFPVPKLDDYLVPIGKARVIRQGAHVTLVAHSISVALIMDAAEKLAAEGIEAELIDLRSLRPLDVATVIQSVKKTNRLVTVEQGWPVCSIGSEIASQVVEHAFDYLDAPPVKIAGKDVPMPYAANLEKLALPAVAEVVAAAKSVLYRE